MAESKHMLAAIMFTDIVGYSKIMGEDEEKAIGLLKQNVKIHQLLLKKYNGVMLKEIADGILAKFNSSSDAVMCALNIQTASKKENIPLRIGIHQGEVIFEKGDVFGDGVNVASRIEQLTDQGKVFISDSVYRDIKNKSDLESKFIEEKQLKNIEIPVKIYEAYSEIELTGIQGLKPTKKIPVRPIALLFGFIIIFIALYFLYLNIKQASPDETKIVKSLAVLPFKNYSPNEENQYYIDGLVEDVLTKLSPIKELRIVSRTSTEQYRNVTKSIQEIGNELNARYIVEGSGRIYEDQVKISVQLIDSDNDQHIWAMDTIAEMQDILSMQSNIATRIVEHLKINLTDQDKYLLDRRLTDNPRAYDQYVRAFENNLSIDGFKKSIIQLKMAIEIDDNFDQAWAQLSELYINITWFGEDLTTNLDSATWACNKALEINPLNSYAYYTKAYIYLKQNNDDLCFENLKKAYQLGSDHPLVYYWLCAYYKSRREYEEAYLVLLEGLSRFIVYDDQHPNFYSLTGWTFCHGYDTETAEKIFLKGLTLFPDYLGNLYGLRYMSKLNQDHINAGKYTKIMHDTLPEFPKYINLLAKCLLREERLGEAEKLFEIYKQNAGEDIIIPVDIDFASYIYELGYIKIQNGQLNKGTDLVNQYIDLRKDRKHYVNYDLARCYAILGEEDNTFEYLQKAYPYKIYFNYPDPIFENIKQSPEISEFINSKNSEFKKEMIEARLTFRNIYEKLIKTGKLKRIEDYL
jgi:TolB-like protein/Tfp pilus assembly protein PilF